MKNVMFLRKYTKRLIMGVKLFFVTYHFLRGIRPKKSMQKSKQLAQNTYPDKLSAPKTSKYSELGGAEPLPNSDCGKSSRGYNSETVSIL